MEKKSLQNKLNMADIFNWIKGTKKMKENLDNH